MLNLLTREACLNLVSFVDSVIANGAQRLGEIMYLQKLSLLIFALLICLGADTTNAQETEPRKIAFLVGINDYKKKNLPDLQYAENDVAVVAKQLRRLGFETTVLTGRAATEADITRELNSFIDVASDLESDDIVFAMFSGHGQELKAVVERRQQSGDEVAIVKRVETIPYFCARDAVPFDKTRHVMRGKTEQQVAEEFKLVSLNELIGRLDQESNSLRNLLIVDACRNDPSKGAGKAANISGSTVNELPTGLSILFAAKSGQKSWESSDPSVQHGVMTHFLIEGLQGEALDKQGEFTWGDLTNFIKKSVIRNRGKLAGGSERIQNPHSINSNSDVIVLGRGSKLNHLSDEEIDKRIRQKIESVKERTFEYKFIETFLVDGKMRAKVSCVEILPNGKRGEPIEGVFLAPDKDSALVAVDQAHCDLEDISKSFEGISYQALIPNPYFWIENGSVVATVESLDSPPTKDYVGIPDLPNEIPTCYRLEDFPSNRESEVWKQVWAKLENNGSFRPFQVVRGRPVQVQVSVGSPMGMGTSKEALKPTSSLIKRVLNAEANKK